MASIFGHGAMAFTISNVVDSKNTKLLLLLAIISSILPDIDVLTFHFDVPYSHPFGHRGFTHSILFALIWAIILMFFFGKKRKGIWFVVILLSILSHGLLDAMTSGGRGVGFFIPFYNERFFLPFRGIKVSPLNISEFFSDWGMNVIFSEIRFIILPCLVIFVISKWIKRGR